MLGVVILNYRTYMDSIDCVHSIMNTYEGVTQFFIIDNDSPNESESELREHFANYENVNIINTHFNGGYSFGNNTGVWMAVQAGCDYVMVTNSDVLFVSGTIKNLLVEIEQDDRIGIITPEICNPQMKRTFAHKFMPVNKKEVLFSLTILNLLDKRKGYRELLGVDYSENKPKEIFSASGCCFIMRASLYKSIGHFDDNTFLGWEEPILGRQAQEQKYKVIYDPRERIIHNHKGSTKFLGAKAYTMGLNSEIYYIKHYLKPGVGYLVLFSFIQTLRYLVYCVQDRSYLTELAFFIKNFYSRIAAKEGLNESDRERISRIHAIRYYGSGE